MGLIHHNGCDLMRFWIVVIDEVNEIGKDIQEGGEGWDHGGELNRNGQWFGFWLMWWVWWDAPNRDKIDLIEMDGLMEIGTVGFPIGV